MVNGLGLGDDKVHMMDFAIKDFISASSFPFTVVSGNDEAQKIGALQDLFISPGRLTDLGSLIKIQIIQKLAPGLHKEGYHEETSHAANQTEERERRQQPVPNREGEPIPQHDSLHDDRLPPYAQPRPFDGPLAAIPQRPLPADEFPPPGFEDEYELRRPLRGGIGGERRPLNIGERDLYPPGLGPHDPLRGGGFGLGGGVGGGGMHPTFDDPLFRGGGGPGTNIYDGRYISLSVFFI